MSAEGPTERQAILAGRIAEESEHVKASSLLDAPERTVEAVAEALLGDPDEAVVEATANANAPDLDDYDAGVDGL
jgi:hypothetical protein